MQTLITVTLFGSFFILLFLEMPIAISLGVSSLFTVLLFNLAPLEFIPQVLVGTNDSFTLLAIPFYIFAGLILSRTGIAKRLVNFSNFFVGSAPGGLGIVTIIAAIFLAGISGSGPADVVAIGLIMYPAMIKAGYKKEFTASLIATSGGIGIIIPPSIALIIYGVIAEASISKLFIAGIIPGIMIGLSLIIVTIMISKKEGYRPISVIPKTRKNFIRLFKDAIWGLLAFVIILGGIYSGIFI
ncbi:MAG: TRAP transporter large permease subunit, partial [Spirochaetes bacterium]|nr:TRAP transporter large permease subunit [Spirochaetota bacterium]